MAWAYDGDNITELLIQNGIRSEDPWIGTSRMTFSLQLSDKLFNNTSIMWCKWTVSFLVNIEFIEAVDWVVHHCSFLKVRCSIFDKWCLKWLQSARYCNHLPQKQEASVWLWAFDKIWWMHDILFCSHPSLYCKIMSPSPFLLPSNLTDEWSQYPAKMDLVPSICLIHWR